MKSTAAGLAALGRGPDTMLVHMSPREVAGLQHLAMAHGGSLTTNPHTGLPEAGFLDKMLPTLIGVGLSFMGVPAWAAGLGTGAFETARTGDIGKGLMAGLGAFGGAGLGGALGSMGATTPSTIAANLGVEGAATGAGSQAAMLAEQSAGFGNAGLDAVRNAAATAPGASLAAAPSPMQNVIAGAQQLGQPGGISQLGSGLMEQYGGKMGATAAGVGAINALGGFEQPRLGFAAPQQQASNAKLSGPIRRPYDPNRNLYTDYGILQPTYAAKGGEMHSVPQLEDGGFVLTKKAVDGMGKGSNDRGQRAAAAGLGAIPIKGPGTGTSDSIPTTIDGVRPAKVSNGEAYVPQKRVKQAGGAKKLYALMRKAENDARRRAA